MSLSKLQLEWYFNHNNYLIEITSNSIDTVAIYFCSNNLFFPHDEKSFRKNLVEKDKYEWYTTRVKRASKHIFLRDIYKQWYVSGINANISNVKSLYEFLYNECKEFKEIVTVGSSAGGYAATLFGSMLNANICFNFNGQWELFSSIVKDGNIVSPLLYEYQAKNRIDFFDIAKPEYDKDCVFYFLSTKSQWDVLQNEHASSLLNVNRIYFKTSHHGVPFLKSSLNEILQYDKESLKSLNGRIYHPILFSFRVSGVKKSSNFLTKQLWNIIKKKLQYF